MPTSVSFRGWMRPGVGDLVSGPVEEGRAAAQVALRLEGRDASDQVRGHEETIRFLLAGPGDVTGIQLEALARRYPAPRTGAAETTMCAYVEFADPGLPWRYTAAANPPVSDKRLQPWIVLVVGTEEEIRLAGDRATLNAAVQQAHPVAHSFRWAHVQEGDGQTVSRVLSPRPLEPNTDYVAAVVAGFAVGSDGSVGPAWAVDPARPAAPVTVPVYAHWRFRTGRG